MVTHDCADMPTSDDHAQVRRQAFKNKNSLKIGSKLAYCRANRATSWLATREPIDNRAEASFARSTAWIHVGLPGMRFATNPIVRMGVIKQSPGNRRY